MPAKDIYHDVVKQALIKDGWTITDDPLRLRWTKRNIYIDLGAERIIGAERSEHRIAVEVKSFTSASEVADLEQALGQYVLYHDILEEIEPERVLYLAISQETYVALFETLQIGEILLRKKRLRLILFAAESMEIAQWID